MKITAQVQMQMQMHIKKERNIAWACQYAVTLIVIAIAPHPRAWARADIFGAQGTYYAPSR